MEKAKRPRVVRSVTVRVATGCGNAYVTPTYVNGKLFECFMHLGKAGGCPIAQGEALLRSLSIGLRYGVPVEEYIEQLKGISCPSHAWDNGRHVMSCPDAIARILEEFKVEPELLGGTKPEQHKTDEGGQVAQDDEELQEHIRTVEVLRNERAKIES